jgi:DNA polymerase IV
VTLKLKDADFRTITRARSLPVPVADQAQFAEAARALLDGVLPLPQPVRLMGLTLSALEGETAGAATTAPSPAAEQASLPF